MGAIDASRARPSSWVSHSTEGGRPDSEARVSRACLLYSCVAGTVVTCYCTVAPTRALDGWTAVVLSLSVLIATLSDLKRVAQRRQSTGTASEPEHPRTPTCAVWPRPSFPRTCVSGSWRPREAQNSFIHSFIRASYAFCMTNSTVPRLLCVEITRRLRLPGMWRSSRTTFKPQCFISLRTRSISFSVR